MTVIRTIKAIKAAKRAAKKYNTSIYWIIISKSTLGGYYMSINGVIVERKENVADFAR
jgi:hypothetical protein